jgi:hypothetical protein
MSALLSAVRELCLATSGIDWDAERVSACVRSMREAARGVDRSELASALEIAVARLSLARVEDADGVAHVAISAGSMVEWGAPPEPLARVLLERLPDVLTAARRFADRCLPAIADDVDPWSGIDDRDVVAEVDGRPILRETFRACLPSDRGGGAALAYLEQWVLPTVAALTRHRELHRRATENEELVSATAMLQHSVVHWLHKLFATQLDARWLVVCPARIAHPRDRVFELRVDQVATNFELFELVADALVEYGVSDLRGSSRGPGYVKGSFDFYDVGALPYLSRQLAVPLERFVFGEGVPTDVQIFRNARTLIAAPPTISRTWNAASPFKALEPSVSVVRELSQSDVRELVSAMRAGES